MVVVDAEEEFSSLSVEAVEKNIGVEAEGGCNGMAVTARMWCGVVDVRRRRRGASWDRRVRMMSGG